MCTSQPPGGPQGLSQEKAYVTGLQVSRGGGGALGEGPSAPLPSILSIGQKRCRALHAAAHK